MEVQTLQSSKSELDETIRFPTEEYKREDFYENFDNVRYMIKIRLTNGVQAEDVPIGIEDLIEYMGDVRISIDNADGISTRRYDYNHWTAKLGTDDGIMLDSVDWKDLESKIENLAENHGIALEKTVSMSGRGYDSEEHRMVMINYKFGSYSEDKDYWISNENNPTCYVEWVGGSIGIKEHLKENPIEIKSVKSKTPTIFDKFSERFRKLFNLNL